MAASFGNLFPWSTHATHFFIFSSYLIICNFIFVVKWFAEAQILAEISSLLSVLNVVFSYQAVPFKIRCGYMALLVKVIKTLDSPWRKTTFAVFLTSKPLFKWNKATYKQALILLYKVSASWKGSKHQNCSLELATHGNWLLLLLFIIEEVSHWEP